MVGFNKSVFTGLIHANFTSFFSMSPCVVPTNYRIKVSRDKSKPFTKDDDEDKNLGRWVNRQRSMFQAGKLRKDRQLALEKIGLKWSMLATTSWESMFETLCQYVKGKEKGGNEWDGNVPANYRTEDVPPRALGRWINRQRSAYGKNKLKPEYVAKLNGIGLKWSIHERRPTYHQYARPDATTSSAAKSPDVVKSNVHKVNPSTTPKTQKAVTATTTLNPAVAAASATNSSVTSVVKEPNNVDKEKETKRPDTIGSAESLPTSTKQIEKVEPSVTAANTAGKTETVVAIATTAVTKEPVKETVTTSTGVAVTAQQVEEKTTPTDAVTNATLEQRKPLITSENVVTV